MTGRQEPQEREQKELSLLRAGPVTAVQGDFPSLHRLGSHFSILQNENPMRMNVYYLIWLRIMTSSEILLEVTPDGNVLKTAPREPFALML